MGAADTRIHVFKSEILADAECFISGPELKSDMFTLQVSTRKMYLKIIQKYFGEGRGYDRWGKK